MTNKKPIAVIGAGNSGLAMAAHLTQNHEKVHLWNRSFDNIKALSETMIIQCDGVIRGNYCIEMVSSDLKSVLEGVELILVTVPANAHHEIARVLSPLLKGGEMILLNPGRTLGVMEFINVLKLSGCKAEVIVAETQTIVYTCRKTNHSSVAIYAMKNDVLLSGLDPSLNKMLIKKLPTCLQPYFTAAENMIQTSIGNVGMILHCIPTLFNTGWIESPRTNFKYYYEGITPSIAVLLEKLDQERLEVAANLGFDIETTAQWLRRSFHLNANNLHDCIQKNKAYQTIDAPLSLKHRYILEDVPYGLVPLEAIGLKLGIKMDLTKLIIDLASELLKTDFRIYGRNLNRLGLEQITVDDILKIFSNKPEPKK